MLVLGPHYCVNREMSRPQGLQSCVSAAEATCATPTSRTGETHAALAPDLFPLIADVPFHSGAKKTLGACGECTHCVFPR